MKKNVSNQIDLPENVDVEIQGRNLIIKGPKGELNKRFSIPKIVLTLKDNKLNISTKSTSKNEKKLVNTYKAHINNMINGVIEGFAYKLKICSSHFPMKVLMKENKLEIKNFMGEKVPRVLKIKKNVTVKVNGDEILVEALDKDLAGQVSADIEKSTFRSGFDNRIFQDGIYITKKPGKIIR